MSQRIVYLIIAITFFSCSQNEGTTPELETEKIDSSYCNCSELTLDEGYNHFYRFERRKGFTGKCEEFYSDGKIKASKNYKNGKLHGKHILYYEDGKVKQEKEFDMNFQTGEQIDFTRDGQVIYHAIYKRGEFKELILTRPDLRPEDW